jgi:hypothetical protein
MVKRRSNPQNTFKQLQAEYKLKTPEQIKMRIIWNHMQALVVNVAGDNPDNLRKLKRYDIQFRLCEDFEKNEG